MNDRRRQFDCGHECSVAKYILLTYALAWTINATGVVPNRGHAPKTLMSGDTDVL
jgi:hypothetical protein